MKLRSLLYVPADNPRFIAKAETCGADAVILDLEDSVLDAAKPAARAALGSAVPRIAAAGPVVMVRINQGNVDDARAAVGAGAAMLLVPKVRQAGDVADLDRALTEIEAGAGRAAVGLIAMIEDPGAMLEARSIAGAPRVCGLLAGGEDLAMAMNAFADPDVLRIPKLLVHYAAKAAGLLSFGLLRSVADFADQPAMAAAAREAWRFGFDGATCVHPTVVPLLNRGFAPDPDQIDWARRVLAADPGQGAFRIDGKMVDAPVIARARRIIEQT